MVTTSKSKLFVRLLNTLFNLREIMNGYVLYVSYVGLLKRVLWLSIIQIFYFNCFLILCQLTPDLI